MARQLQDFLYGKYYALEEKAGEGYNINTEKSIYEVKYKDSKTPVIDVEKTENDGVTKGKFEVIKISSNESTIAPIVEGAGFTAILKKYVDYYGSFDEARKHLNEFAEDEYSVFKTSENGHGTSGFLAYRKICSK